MRCCSMAALEQNLRRLLDARDVLRRHGTPELAEMVARVREGYRVALHSRTLGEQFLLVRNETARRDVPAGEARTVYTLAEVEALAGAPPDLVRALHALKAPLAGLVVAVELGA